MTRPAPSLSYAEVMLCMQAYQAAHLGELVGPLRDAFIEVADKLLRLDHLASRLISTNNELMGTQPTVTLEDGHLVITLPNGETKRFPAPLLANGEKPTQIIDSASTRVYRPGMTTTEPRNAKMLEFEGDLENYYQIAFDVVKLVKHNFKPKFDAPGINLVRNKLLGHRTTRGEVDKTTYSFGYGSEGPQIRPMRHPDQGFVDAGLVANTNEFIDLLRKAF